MAKLESLIVDIQANTAELQKGLDDANRKLAGFGQKLNDLAGVVVFEKMAKMAGQAAKGLIDFALSGAESLDQMGKLAQSSGTTVEKFSQLAYAGELAGVSAEELGGAMVKLDKNISAAATGSKEQVALFGALGVKVTDAAGKVRTADAVMGDLADRFAGMADGASKSKLAVDVFGKSGAALIPMLNGGKAGLAELAKEADRLGITISTGATKAAEEFNDNLTRLHSVVGAVKQQVAANLTPSLAALTSQLLKNEDGVSGMTRAAEVLSSLLRVLATGAVVTAAAFQMVGEGIARAASAAVDWKNGTGSDELTGTDRKVALIQLADARRDLSAAQQNVSLHATSGDLPPPALAALIAATEIAQKRVDTLVTSLGGIDAPAPPETKSFMAPLEDMDARISAIWKQSAEESKKSAKVQTDSGDEIAKKFADDTAAAERFKSGMKSLTDQITQQAAALEGFGKSDLGKLDASLSTGKLAQDLADVGENAESLKATIHALGEELQRLQVDKITTATSYAMERSAAAQSSSSADRTTAFNNIGPAGIETTMRAINSATAGFTDFQDALAKLASSTQEQQRLLGAAESAKVKGQFELAHQAELAADEAGRAAGKADKAADAFGRLAETVIQKQQQIVSMALSVIGSIGEHGKDVAQLAQAAMQGFQAGGIWGAIIAVIASLFAKLEAVGKFVDGLFDGFMKGFGQLNDSMSALFGSLSQSLEPVMQLLQATFKALGDVLMPLFEVMRQVIGPMEALVQATGILDVIVQALATVLNVVSLVIGGIVLALQYVWDGILKAVRAVVAAVTLGQGTAEIDKTIAAHEKAIRENQARIDRASRNLSGVSSSTDAQTDSTSDGGGPGVGTGSAEFEAVWVRNEERNRKTEAARYTAYSDAIAAGSGVEAATQAGEEAKRKFLELNPLTAVEIPVGDLGKEADKAAKALAKFTGSLTNVPQGFRYQAHAFDATNAVAKMDGGRDAPVTVVVQGSVISGEELVTIIDVARRRGNYRRTGSGSFFSDNTR